jgi:hypothetical protein
MEDAQDHLLTILIRQPRGVRIGRHLGENNQPVAFDNLPEQLQKMSPQSIFGKRKPFPANPIVDVVDPSFFQSSVGPRHETPTPILTNTVTGAWHL